MVTERFSMTKTLLAFVFTCIAITANATPISDRYAQLGGSGGFLGSPTTTEKFTPDGLGRFRHYQHGSIYFHPQTWVHEVHGMIRTAGRSSDGSSVSSAIR
jgi:uncharacterized protein with LGFP repeats